VPSPTLVTDTSLKFLPPAAGLEL